MALRGGTRRDQRPCRRASSTASACRARGAQQAVQSAAEQQVRELCETILCYPPGAVHVTLQNGQVATLDSDFPLPIVDHDIVYAFPGKTIFIAGDVKDGKVVNLHAVAAPEKPQNVLRVHLFQEAGKPATFLTITNYFGVPVKYQAGMRLPQKQDFLSTSTCPVRARGSASRESWPHPIFQLALHDFEVLGKGVAASCD